jgi:hypothetical protein
MAGRRKPDDSADPVKDAVPNRKHFVSMLIHLKRPIQRHQNRNRIERITIL